LLWCAHHLAHNSVIGRPWADVGPVLDRQRATKLRSDEYQLGTAHTYRMKRNGYTTPVGIAHDLVVVFHVGGEPSEDKPTVPRVFGVDVRLEAMINKRFAEFATTKPYPAGTVAAKVLEAQAAIDAAKSCPILQNIEIGYAFLVNRWIDYNPHGFD